MVMPDGNTAALRQHEAMVASQERAAPTDDEFTAFVDDWLQKKRKELGIEFISEALVERSDDTGLMAMFQAWDGPRAELATALINAVEAYWRPMAEEAAQEHDFEADRVPCRCRGEYCTC